MKKQKVLQLAIVSSDMKNKILDICTLVYKFECYIISTRIINKMGQKTALYVLGGDWNNISKLESSLQSLELSEDDKIILKTSEDSTKSKARSTMLYHLNIVSHSEENILPNLYNFCEANDINILNLTADSNLNGEYKTFMLNAQIEINALVSLSDIREQFMLFCDGLNIDGILDPIRPY